MTLRDMRSVRRDWMYGVLIATQRFACATQLGDPLHGLSYIDAYLSELPETRSAVEQLLLKTTLLDVALRWTTELHEVHRLGRHCECDATAVRDLTHEFGREVNDARLPFSNWARKHVRQFVREHPELVARQLAARLDRTNGLQRCDISTLAPAAGCSAEKVRAAFINEFQLSPREYQTRLRVRHALALLTTTTEKVEAVARDAGFSGKRHFYRAVRRFTGLTPTAIRQRGTSAGWDGSRSSEA
jgi:AraC-like DNA-binding protein